MASDLDRARPEDVSRPRLDSLTGLRFLAALLVFGSHAGIAFLSGDGFASRFFAVGRCGVSFFFMLSGFVLTWSASASVGGPTFYWRRFARVWPSHAAAWLAGIVAFGGSLVGIGLGLVLMQAWVPNQSVYFAANPVAWSLSCEAFFYLMFPFLIGPLSRLDPRSRWLLLGGLTLVALLAPTAASALLGDSASWAVYIFPPTRLVEFVAGVLLALLLADGRIPRTNLWVALAAALAGYLLAMALPPLDRDVAATFFPFALLLVAAAQRDLAGGSVFASRPIVRLGIWSYAFYLVHLFVISGMDRVIELEGRPIPVGLALAALALAAALAAAAVLHGAVERPFERVLRPRRPGLRRAHAAPEAPVAVLPVEGVGGP